MRSRHQVEDGDGAVIAELLLGPAAGQHADRLEPWPSPRPRCPSANRRPSRRRGARLLSAASTRPDEALSSPRRPSSSTRRSVPRVESVDEEDRGRPRRYELASTTVRPRRFSSRAARTRRRAARTRRVCGWNSACVRVAERVAATSSTSSPATARRTGRRPSRCDDGAATPGGRCRSDESAVPRERVLVVGIDERPVEIQQRRRGHYAARTSSAPARVHALAELLDELRAERGQVVGLRRRDEPLVDDDFLVDPVRARISEIRLDATARK